MRHALAMFGFCLFLPRAAFACMAMESGAMGTQGLLMLVSFFLGLILLFMGTVYCLRLPKSGALRPVLCRARKTAFIMGLSCIGFAVINAFIDMTGVVAAVLFSVLLYKIILPVLVRRGMAMANALHSIKIAGEKTSSTRRLAAAGDVQ